MSSKLIMVLIVLVGSVVFPAVGYYLDWKASQKRKKKTSKN
jgi:hypothetical protein